MEFVKARVASVGLTEKSQLTQAVQSVSAVVSAVASAIASAVASAVASTVSSAVASADVSAVASADDGKGAPAFP